MDASTSTAVGTRPNNKTGKPVKPISGPSVRPAQAAQFFGVHISTIWRWVAERPDFPRPRKVGPRTTVFDTAELVAFREKSLAEG